MGTTSSDELFPIHSINQYDVTAPEMGFGIPGEATGAKAVRVGPMAEGDMGGFPGENGACPPTRKPGN